MVEASAEKLDFLKEIANIGLGHAATSLSSMINSRVDISLPELSFLPFGNVNTLKSGTVCAVKTGIYGDAKGAVILIINDDTAFWLVDKISGNPEGKTHMLTEMGFSAIKEFTNIISGAFLTAMSNFMDYNLMPKVPETFTGKASTIKEDIRKNLQSEAAPALYVKTEIYVEERMLKADIFLLLDSTSFEEMFQKMSEKCLKRF